MSSGGPDEATQASRQHVQPHLGSRPQANRTEVSMSRQDRYIPGVPCWVDSTQPDPDAAVTFYGGLFAWDFDDVMPPDAPGTYFVARLPGGDVAAIGSQ